MFLIYTSFMIDLIPSSYLHRRIIGLLFTVTGDSYSHTKGHEKIKNNK